MKVVEPGWLTQSPSRCGGRPGFGCMLDSLSTVPEALEILRISRTKFYQLVAEKRIALVKLGAAVSCGAPILRRLSVL
jgi:hypothetical protein